jgi:CheY-like chemotaxis protein
MFVRYKKFPANKHIPVIMLSTTVEQAQLCQELGAKGYVQKPSDLTLLQTALSRVIEFVPFIKQAAH